MRISSSFFNNTIARQMMQGQRELSHLQQQLASGKRVLQPSDDPVAAGQKILLDQSSAQLEQYNRNSDFAESRLVVEETALAGMLDITTSIQNLALAAKNDSNGPAERHIYQQQLTQLKAALMGQLNTTNPGGGYIFSGSRHDVPPYTINPESETEQYIYRGDSNSNSVGITHGQRIEIGTPANAIVEAVQQDGNGQTRELNLLRSIDALYKTLQPNSGEEAEKTAFQKQMTRHLEELDALHSHINNQRSATGFRMARIDRARDDNASWKVQVQTELSALSDIDYVDVITRFQTELSNLEALQATYSRLQNISLFNRLQ